MPEIIHLATAPVLSNDQRRSLQCLAALMIPSSAQWQLPGADDPVIFADIVRSLGRDAAAVGTALRHLDELCAGVFADQTSDQRQHLVSQFRETHGALATVLVAVIVRCYYRDDRVMRSLGMELRAPYPKGFDVEQGDWNLLDPVRARGKIYTEVPPANRSKGDQP